MVRRKTLGKKIYISSNSFPKSVLFALENPSPPPIRKKESSFLSSPRYLYFYPFLSFQKKKKKERESRESFHKSANWFQSLWNASSRQTTIKKKRIENADKKRNFQGKARIPSFEKQFWKDSFAIFRSLSTLSLHSSFSPSSIPWPPLLTPLLGQSFNFAASSWQKGKPSSPLCTAK